MSEDADITVIGLGQGGGNIAEGFDEYPNYDCKAVDSVQRDDLDIESYKVPEAESHEEYDAYDCEDLIPDLYDSIDTEQVYFILCGSGKISGLSLRLLYPIRKRDRQGNEREEGKRVHCFYVEPDKEFLTEKQKKRNRATRGILQQYARSDNFEKIYLARNENIEAIIGDVPVKKYFDRINELLVYSVDRLNVFRHSEPVYGKIDSVRDVNRIATLGVLKEGREQLFYPLKFVRERVYYYSILTDRLESDSELLPNIKEEVSQKKEEGEDISFGIFESNNEDFNYCTLHTSAPQEMNVDTPDNVNPKIASKLQQQ